MGRVTTCRVITVLFTALAAWAGVWMSARRLDILVTEQSWASRVPVAAAAVVGLGAVGGVLLARVRPRWFPLTAVAATSVLVSGLATIALHGTRWGFYALHADSSFRTQAVTRFSDSPALMDYGYADLPAYYPPAWPWLQGRVADLLDVAAWTVTKPATLVFAALIPVGAYLLWRRVVPDAQAALIVLGTTLATADLQKPEEWLVLACAVPWWLEVVRGIRAEHRTALPPWGHGLILGGLLLTHTYYFLPLTVATVLGWLVDLLARQRPALRLRDALIVGSVGLAVSAPYWVRMVVSQITARGTDHLQMRWSEPGFEMPPLPVPTDWMGAGLFVGLVWIVLRLRTEALARGLGLGLAAGYLVVFGGQWLQRFDVALLPDKARPFVGAVLVAGGVCALIEVGRALLARPRAVWTAVSLLTVTAVTVAVVARGAQEFTDVWVVGFPAQLAHETRYPDGSYPRAVRQDEPPSSDHVWGASPGDPSTQRVRRAWLRLSGRPPTDDPPPIVVTTRADLLATTSLHSFTAWKSIYSHPNGEYDARVDLLRQVAHCPTSPCAAHLLRDNRFDPIDGVIAQREDGHLVVPLAVDNFPEAWERVELRLPLRLFRAPWFGRIDVGAVSVVAPQQR